jgi:hypothetical protein
MQSYQVRSPDYNDALLSAALGLTDADGVSQLAAGWGANIMAACSAVKHSLAGSLRHSLGPKVSATALFHAQAG